MDSYPLLITLLFIVVFMAGLSYFRSRARSLDSRYIQTIHRFAMKHNLQMDQPSSRDLPHVFGRYKGRYISIDTIIPPNSNTRNIRLVLDTDSPPDSRFALHFRRGTTTGIGTGNRELDIYFSVKSIPTSFAQQIFKAASGRKLAKMLIYSAKNGGVLFSCEIDAVGGQIALLHRQFAVTEDELNSLIEMQLVLAEALEQVKDLAES